MLVQRAGQAGGGLVALMISVALSLGIVLSALRAVVLAGIDYLRTEQDALLQDQADYVIDVLTMAFQQAGHVDASLPMQAVAARPAQGALYGLDNVSVPATSAGLDAAMPGGSSDALAVLAVGDAAGRARNCAGMPVPVPTGASDQRGWSVIHVAAGPLNEPELHCKYRGASGWVSQAIATGVESLQLLYGLDWDDDGLPNDFVSASRLHALQLAQVDDTLILRTRIVAVHVALLLRSQQAISVPISSQPVDLFGKEYGDHHAADDPGTRLFARELRPNRLYRQFDAVIFLRNRLRPMP